MYIRWNDSLKTGINEIDLEHKALIDEYERLYNSTKSGKGCSDFKSTVNFIESYINTHFANEERIQEEINYVHREEHRKIHNEIKNEIKKFIISIKKEKYL